MPGQSACFSARSPGTKGWQPAVLPGSGSSISSNRSWRSAGRRSSSESRSPGRFPARRSWSWCPWLSASAAASASPIADGNVLARSARNCASPQLCFSAGGSAHRRVQCHGGANERLQRLFINLVALMEIDGTPGVAFEAGVEEARRVLQRGALGEGHLHDILVRLTGADNSGVRPHRNPSPLPLLDHFGVGLLDENSDPSDRLAPPITQLLDSRIYQLRGRVSSFSFLRAALPLLHGCSRFLHDHSSNFSSSAKIPWRDRLAAAEQPMLHRLRLKAYGLPDLPMVLEWPSDDAASRAPDPAPQPEPTPQTPPPNLVPEI